MAITNQEVVDELVRGEDYYLYLSEININNMKIGVPLINLEKIDTLFYIINSLRYRVDREVFDSTSTKLYYKLIRLLPIIIN